MYQGIRNDIVTTDKLKDIFMTLTHLGHLSHNTKMNSVVIPNHEIRSEFIDTVLDMEGTPLEELMKGSAELLDATIARDEGKVSDLVTKIHLGYSSMKRYKNGETLTAIVRYAYIFTLGNTRRYPRPKPATDIPTSFSTP